MTEQTADAALDAYLLEDEDDVIEIPPKPTLLEELRDSFRPQKLIASAIAGSITGIIAITIAIAFASLIFNGELSSFVPRSIGFLMFGSIVISVIASLFCSVQGTVAGLNDAGIAVLSVIAATLMDSAPAGTPPEALFATMVGCIMAASLVTGVFFVGLGFLKLGNLIRFIPYPVIGGFLSGSGLLLIKGALGVMTGAEMGEALTQPSLYIRWLPGVAVAVFLLVISKRFSHFLLLPGTLAVSALIFYLVLLVTGTPVEVASAQGWLVEALPAGGLYQPLTPADFSTIDFGFLTSQIGTYFSVAVVVVISLLLNASGIEIQIEQDVDLNRELKVLGAANIAAAAVASPPGGHYLGSTSLVHGMDADSRLVGVAQGILTAGVLFGGASLLGYFPKFILGALILYFGISFVLRWVVTARKELPISDYIVVLLILGVIFFVGFLPGVGLGIVLAVVLFVVNYSRINVIKHELSGRNHHSTVERPGLYRDLLVRKGHWLYMLKLQGFIFFGTSNTLFNQFRARIEDPEQQKPRFFLLDFNLVTGVDSSAMLSFQKMLQLAKQYNIVLIFTSLNDVMKQRLEQEPFGSQKGTQWVEFDDLDHGMEWYEDQVIENFESVGFAIKPPTMTRQLQRMLPSRQSVMTMMDYFEQVELDEGDVLLEQGQPLDGMYFIEDGEMRVELELHDERSIRLRTMSSGTVIGELGVYLKIPATARVIAEKNTFLFFLSAEKLQEMEDNNPEISTAFHKFMAHTIAERLVGAADTMKVLLD